jgi:predicted permease
LAEAGTADVSVSVAALLPIFALVASGWAVRHWRLLDEGFWRPAERLNYFALFPALLFLNVATAPLGELAWGRLAAALVLSLLSLAGVLLLLRPLARADGAGFSSVWQGSLRFNAYVGIAATASLWGRDGLAVAALVIAVLVPVGNFLSVVGLVHWAGARRSLAGTAIAIFGNPLILACLLGVLVNGLGGVPGLVEPLLRILSQSSLALGLLVVGAGLDLAALRGQAPALGLALGAKLALLPILSALACRLLGLDGIAAAVAVLFQALPAAPSSYILARQLGGDAALMAAILTAQIIAAAVTLPIVLALLR